MSSSIFFWSFTKCFSFFLLLFFLAPSFVSCYPFSNFSIDKSINKFAFHILFVQIKFIDYNSEKKIWVKFVLDPHIMHLMHNMAFTITHISIDLKIIFRSFHQHTLRFCELFVQFCWHYYSLQIKKGSWFYLCKPEFLRVPAGSFQLPPSEFSSSSFSWCRGRDFRLHLDRLKVAKCFVS